MQRTSYGYIGIVGVVATMAISPLAETLPLTGLHLAFFRGLPGVAILLLLVLAGIMKVSMPDRCTFMLSCCFAAATVGVFNGIKAWGANLTIILLDLAVLVPIVIGVTKGVRPHKTVMTAFAVALIGSFMSLRVWNTGELALAGLGWSLIALFSNGLFIEFLGRSTQDANTKVFWQSAFLCVIGIFGFGDGLPKLSNSEIVTTAFLAFAMGIGNLYLAVLAFANLHRVVAGVLVLAITPATVISSYLLLGKGFGIDQVVGVMITLGAVWYLGNSNTATKEKNHDL